MRKYEDLSKAEKEKLNTYLQYLTINSIAMIIIVVFALTIFLVGTGLIFIFTIPVIIVTGVLFMGVGYVFILFIMLVNLREKKYLFLIFGYKDTYKDVFNVERKDLRKVKILREIKWIRED